MLTPEEMARDIPGMTLEHARRIIDSAKKSERPASNRVRLYLMEHVKGGYFERYCGETAPGRVSLSVGERYTEAVKQALSGSEFRFAFRGVHYDEPMSGYCADFTVWIDEDCGE